MTKRSIVYSVPNWADAVQSLCNHPENPPAGEAEMVSCIGGPAAMALCDWFYALPTELRLACSSVSMLGHPYQAAFMLDLEHRRQLGFGEALTHRPWY